MKIAELFVGLGVKGADSAGKALSGVKTGLGEVKSMGLETKAMIAAVVYGLERMMSSSAQMGTGLNNFAQLTGMSTKSLQEWQYAARQVGVSGDEVANSMKAVQANMMKTLRGEGAPSGYSMIANKVGLDYGRLRETKYVMEQLQKFAQAVPADIGNDMIKSFGATENVISAMRQDAFRPEVFAKAPIYGDDQIKSLNKVDAAWMNLGQKVEMAFGKFTAKHGMGLVKDLSMMTDSVMKLVEALQHLAEEYKVMQKVGQGLEGIANTLKLFTEITDAMGGKAPKKGDLTYLAPGEEAMPGIKDSPMGKFFSSLFGAAKEAPVDTGYHGTIPLPAIPGSHQIVAPPPAYMQGHGANQTVDVNQTLVFQHDGKDAKKVMHSHETAVKRAYQAIPARSQKN